MKSRTLFSAAIAAIMIGGVVLTPSAALAQSRDGGGSRGQTSRSDNRRSDRNGQQSQRGQRGQDIQRGQRGQNDQWRQRQDNNNNNNRWNDRDHDGDRDRNNNRHNDRDHDDNRWRDRDREDWNRGDGDHDRDDGYRRRVIVRRSYPTYNYGYGNNYGNGYGNSYGYSRSDDWRSIAEASGLLAIIGLLDHDDTLVFVGTAGALYSINRYNDDRYSRDPECRLRAEYFSHPYFYRNGRRYDREIVTRHGEQYYRFACR